jgi:hypothetical protein
MLVPIANDGELGARANVAVVGRDDASSHRAAEAERIADREHPVTDAGILLQELHVRELLRSLEEGLE